MSTLTKKKNKKRQVQQFPRAVLEQGAGQVITLVYISWALQVDAKKKKKKNVWFFFFPLDACSFTSYLEKPKLYTYAYLLSFHALEFPGYLEKQKPCTTLVVLSYSAGFYKLS